jgi:hypothetical protein
MVHPLERQVGSGEHFVHVEERVDRCTLKTRFGDEWRVWRASLGIVQSLYSSKPGAELEMSLLVDPKLLESVLTESPVVTLLWKTMRFRLKLLSKL